MANLEANHVELRLVVRPGGVNDAMGDRAPGVIVRLDGADLCVSVWRHVRNLDRKFPELALEIFHESWVLVCRDFVGKTKRRKPKAVEHIEDVVAFEPRAEGNQVVASCVAYHAETSPRGAVASNEVEEIDLDLIVEEAYSGHFRR